MQKVTTVAVLMKVTNRMTTPLITAGITTIQYVRTTSLVQKMCAVKDVWIHYVNDTVRMEQTLNCECQLHDVYFGIRYAHLLLTIIITV